MTLNYRDDVSIAEIVVYVPSLCIAVFLALRHGIGRNAGWVFLIIFCLARIIGPAMQLAEIAYPTTTALYTGSAILQSVGLSPLMLATIGLLSRLLASINRNKRTSLSPRIFLPIHLLVTVGLILGIVGGIDAADSFVSSGFQSYTPASLSKVGVALFIVAYLAIVLVVALLSFHVSHAEKGERRIFIAVVLSLPLLLIRLAYSTISTFSHLADFNLLTGSVTALLCTALIEEFAIVLLYEGMGLTLRRAGQAGDFQAHELRSRDSEAAAFGDSYAGAGLAPRRQEPKRENALRGIAKYSMIGRLAMAAMPSKEADMAMHQQR